MKRTTIVVSQPQDWPFHHDEVEVISARDFLTTGLGAERGNTRVLNLCRSYRYQREGYYVSLLAAARGHRVFPTVSSMQAMKSSSMARIVSDQIGNAMMKCLDQVDGNRYELQVYFGVTAESAFQPLASAAFDFFSSPLFSLQFERKKNMSWRLRNVQPLVISDIAKENLEVVEDAMAAFVARSRPTRRRKRAARFDIAILSFPEDPTPPSDDKALRLFDRAAERLDLGVEHIDRGDLAYTAHFDALFIRATTNVNDVTYRFAQKAAAEGLVVIDDPQSILRCTNKVFLAELLARNKISAPRSLILHCSQKIEQRVAAIESELGLPCVLKAPDSAFSQGVSRVDDIDKLRRALASLGERSDLVIAQAFMPTDFDWRIGIIDRRPIYACRYHMVDGHWQIYQRDEGSGKIEAGGFDGVPLGAVPKAVLHAALKAANLVGAGLYGVDVKEVKGRAYVIEVNDNPSIEAGVEDFILGDELYNIIMRVFLDRLETRRSR